MSHSCETYAAQVRDSVAALQTAGPLENLTRIVPSLYPSWDTAEGAVTMTFQAETDNLVQLDAKVEKLPRWLTLNLDLGEGGFAPGEVIGLVADIEGDAEDALEIFIRSNTDAGDADTHFAESLPLSPGREIAAALHTIAPGDGIVRSERFHMLIMRLPRRDFRLNLRDMRLFVLPAAEGLRAPAMTLANAAP